MLRRVDIEVEHDPNTGARRNVEIMNDGSRVFKDWEFTRPMGQGRGGYDPPQPPPAPPPPAPAPPISASDRARAFEENRELVAGRIADASRLWIR